MLLHVIWFGEYNEMVNEHCRGWKAKNPSFRLVLWTSKEFLANVEAYKGVDQFVLVEDLENERVKELIVNILSQKQWGIGRFGLASDFLRFEIIYERGGYYVDIDNKPGRLPRYTAQVLLMEPPSVHQKEHDLDLSPSLMGGPRGKPFYKIASEIMSGFPFSKLLKMFNTVSHEGSRWNCVERMMSIFMKTVFSQFTQSEPLRKTAKSCPLVPRGTQVFVIKLWDDPETDEFHTLIAPYSLTKCKAYGNFKTLPEIRHFTSRKFSGDCPIDEAELGSLFTSSLVSKHKV
jgi:hypothetical protein